MKVKLLQ